MANEQVAEFLSIDCQRLAQSVSCVPLHHRLHIDELFFDVSFYHAMHVVFSSYVVCLSIRLSMMLMICDRMCWVTSKVITWIIGLESSHFGAPMWAI